MARLIHKGILNGNGTLVAEIYHNAFPFSHKIMEHDIPETFEKESKSPDPQIRFKVASNTNTPKPILANLADDPNDSVKQAVAGNINTDIDTLQKLKKNITLCVSRKADATLQKLNKQQRISKN
jgi:hypothetical protein